MLDSMSNSFQFKQMTKNFLLWGVLSFFLVACGGSNSGNDEYSSQPPQTNPAPPSTSTAPPVVKNEKPTAHADSPQAINEASQVTLNGGNSSDDGYIVSYLWEQVSGTPVQLQNQNSQSTLFTAPTVTNIIGNEVLQFKLIITDDQGLSDEAKVDITVNAVNEPPVAKAGNDIEIEEGQTIKLSGSLSTDPDQDTLSYSWQKQSSELTAILSDGDTENISVITPNVEADTTLVFLLTVTDGFGGTDVDEVHVLVKNKQAEETLGILTITVNVKVLDIIKAT